MTTITTKILWISCYNLLAKEGLPLQMIYDMKNALGMIYLNKILYKQNLQNLITIF